MSEAQPKTSTTKAPQLLDAALNIVAALVVLFSATLHENLDFVALVFACSVVAIAVANLITGFVYAKGLMLTLVAKAVLAVGVAVSVLLPGLTADAFSLIVLVWAAASAVVNFLQLSGLKTWVHGSKLLTVLPVVLALVLLLNLGDTVAVVGWFGAYAVVYGVFGAIGAFDSNKRPEPGEPTAKVA